MVNADCLFVRLNICFEVASRNQPTGSIFGLAEFLTAVAILAAAYSISDERYKFRIAVSAVPLPQVFFWTTTVVGVGIVLVKLWFDLALPIPRFANSPQYFESVFALSFVLPISFWIYVGFISPPIFKSRNAMKFARQTFSLLSNGNETQLTAVAQEIGRSAYAIVAIARRRVKRRNLHIGGISIEMPLEAKVASDLILMLGDRRLCRAIAIHVPWVAAEIFRCVAKDGLDDIPLAQFSRNVARELFNNTDSAIHHEGDGFRSGLLGYTKPVSRELFGHADLINELARRGGSPLEHIWLDTDSWNQVSWRTYGRAGLMFLENHLNRSLNRNHSYAASQIFHTFTHACIDAYKINAMGDGYGESIEYRKIEITIEFVEKSLELLEKYHVEAPQKQPADQRFNDFFDNLAEIAFELLISVASINSPDWKNWQIQNNMYWMPLMQGFDDTRAWRIFRSRLQRKIYREVRNMDRYLNYKGARVLSVCLNVMGLSEEHEAHRPPEYRALKRLILRWIAKNYLRMREELPDAAAACLGGTISFDVTRQCLVKTYSAGLSREPAREYLTLDGFKAANSLGGQPSGA
ncbi:hypothetical protein [Mesorhizobium sp. M7A.F.Ca.MR.148.00.0.0]|uniref:hypothetical protein n=1 Tax=Mesorhizobium sp. M7A.F.Ca.MR.148.00.0.0 TaxID=2496775 RepID=UPI000FCBA87A|nr:hypothetical protein [Mesorhizobium sp. M7A.F.Ca.MR.148.00.0.0]RUV37520.1 hypothetical protein EOB49_11270 [Mesorhizobium sp. M7A.F.Ca.MR.148.00.0.0]